MTNRRFPYAFAPLAAAVLDLAPALGLRSTAPDRPADYPGAEFYAFGPYVLSLVPEALEAGDNGSEGVAYLGVSVRDDSEVEAARALEALGSEPEEGAVTERLDLAGPASVRAAVGRVVGLVLAVAAVGPASAPVFPSRLPEAVGAAIRGPVRPAADLSEPYARPPRGTEPGDEALDAAIGELVEVLTAPRPVFAPPPGLSTENPNPRDLSTFDPFPTDD